MSFGLLLGAAFPNEESATLIQEVFIAPVLLLCGVPVNLDSVYVWLRWMTYISPLRYTMEILIRNEYEGRSFSAENPIDALDYNTSIGFSFIMLIVLSIIFKIVSIAFLKLNAKR